MSIALVATALAALTSAVPTANARPASRPAGDSCRTPPGVVCVLGIPYIDDGTKVHTLDAYYPAFGAGRASIVIVHGGFWRQSSSASFSREAAYLAQNGFAAFSINYTKSRPDRPSWPRVRRDVEAATAWVMAHADEYHGDNARVGLLGGSSGAHLAALVDTAGPEHGVRPLAAVSWSGAMDLTITYNRGNRAAKHSLTQLLGCHPVECPDAYAAASPVSHVTKGDGALLMFHSSDERIPVAVAHEMDERLTAVGVPHRLIVLRHSTLHARQYECRLMKLDGQTRTVLDDSIRWLSLQLSQPTVPLGTFCP